MARGCFATRGDANACPSRDGKAENADTVAVDSVGVLVTPSSSEMSCTTNMVSLPDATSEATGAGEAQGSSVVAVAGGTAGATASRDLRLRVIMGAGFATGDGALAAVIATTAAVAVVLVLVDPCAGVVLVVAVADDDVVVVGVRMGVDVMFFRAVAAAVDAIAVGVEVPVMPSACGLEEGDGGTVTCGTPVLPLKNVDANEPNVEIDAMGRRVAAGTVAAEVAAGSGTLSVSAPVVTSAMGTASFVATGIVSGAEDAATDADFFNAKAAAPVVDMTGVNNDVVVVVLVAPAVDVGAVVRPRRATGAAGIALALIIGSCVVAAAAAAVVAVVFAASAAAAMAESLASLASCLAAAIAALAAVASAWAALSWVASDCCAASAACNALSFSLTAAWARASCVDADWACASAAAACLAAASAACLVALTSSLLCSAAVLSWASSRAEELALAT